MTFKRFEEILHTKYPEAEACMHGKFGGTEKNKKVEINFSKGGKCYEYYGSYQQVLAKLGIKTAYPDEIGFAERTLADYKALNGKENPYSLFGCAVYDYTREIAKLEQYLADIKNGKYVII